MNKKWTLPILFVILALTSFACNLANPDVLNKLGTALKNQATDSIKNAPSPLPEANDPIASIVNNGNDLTALYENVLPGIVSIQIATPNGGGLGSGFVYDSNGYIVTNEHVIDGATAIEVDFSSGYKTTANVIGADKDSDVAVIKVDAPTNELHPLPLGNSRVVKVGQTVLAIGNPFGLTGSMTLGIVSALGRTQASNRDATASGSFSVADMIQTDAAINPGNSGGPLLDLSGEVIGINRSIRSNNSNALGEASNSGIGFALPINLVKRVVPAIIQNGKFDYPFMGISTLQSELMSLHVIEQLGLQKMTGVYVTAVQPNGPADEAGVIGASEPTNIQGLSKGGDLIIAIDDHEVKTYDDLIGYLVEYKSPGEEINLTVLRGNETKVLTLKLTDRP